MIKSKLKRRLRKKHHSGEFQELGFEISARFSPEFSEVNLDKFIDDFIDEIEKNKLSCGGGGDTEKYEGFVTSQDKYASPSERKAKIIKKWLSNRLEDKNLKVGELRDAWHGW